MREHKEMWTWTWIQTGLYKLLKEFIASWTNQMIYFSLFFVIISS